MHKTHRHTRFRDAKSEKRGQRQMRQKRACIAKSHTSYYSLKEKKN